ncbi:MAG: tetratricopeptide repeat protein [Flavobacteriales bacterium]
MESAETLFLRADRDIKDGYNDLALNSFKDLVSLYPNYGPAHNHLGWLYETKFSNYAEAEKHYKQCLLYNPEYPAVYYNLAIVLSTLGRYDELKDLLKKALTIKGINKATIYNEYGIMFEMIGEYDLAINNYKEAYRFSIDDTKNKIYLDSVERCKNKTSTFS